MKQVADYAELGRHIMCCMKPGFLTNCTLSGSELRERSLIGSVWDGGVQLLERTPTGYYLRYYCLNPDAPEPLPDRTVCETVLRPGQTDDVLGQWGLMPLFRRLRLERPAGQAKAPAPVPPVDAEQVLALLHRNFNPETGCLPTLAELEAAGAEGRLLCRLHNGVPAAVLHVRPGKGAWELRHLAVDGPYRGQGLARSLTEELTERFGDRKLRVWVREDLPSARHIYEQYGFVPDGYTAVVRRKG